MHLNIFRAKRLEEIISEMDITDMKLVSSPDGRITRIDLELMPREEEKADGDDKRHPDPVLRPAGRDKGSAYPD